MLDFSRVFAGPAAGQVLGDLGADVIKIEAPGGGDEARLLGLTEGEAPRLGASASYLALNRNKRSITLDLKSEAGRSVARRLMLGTDVAIHNFRPGSMRRWGLDYDDIRAQNPRLIFGEFFAYGPEGPLSDFGANDLALQAHSGLMSLTGEPDRPPVRVGSAVIDLHGAMALVAGILAALYSREKSGEGQRLETSLLLSSAHLLSYFYTEYWLDGVVRKPMGTANHLSVPNQVFPSADGQVVIIAPSDAMWRRCAQALGPGVLDIPRYATVRDRQTHRGEVVAAISGITRQLPGDEIVRRLAAVKVNVARVNSIAEAADHPQLALAGGCADVEYGGEQVRTVASPFRLHGTPARVRRDPPELGRDRDAILADFGFDDAEIRTLRDEGAFGSD